MIRIVFNTLLVCVIVFFVGCNSDKVGPTAISSSLGSESIAYAAGRNPGDSLVPQQVGPLAADLERLNNPPEVQTTKRESFPSGGRGAHKWGNTKMQDITARHGDSHVYYACRTNEIIYRAQTKGGDWNAWSGMAKRITMRESDEPWCVNSSGMIWRVIPGSGWVQASGVYPEHQAKDIGSNSSNVWIVDERDYIYRFDWNQGKFVHHGGAAAIAIEGTSGDEFVCVNSAGDVWEWKARRWLRIGKGTTYGAKEIGGCYRSLYNCYMIDKNNYIRYYNGASVWKKLDSYKGKRLDGTLHTFVWIGMNDYPYYY